MKRIAILLVGITCFFTSNILLANSNSPQPNQARQKTFGDAIPHKVQRIALPAYQDYTVRSTQKTKRRTTRAGRNPQTGRTIKIKVREFGKELGTRWGR